MIDRDSTFKDREESLRRKYQENRGGDISLKERLKRVRAGLEGLEEEGPSQEEKEERERVIRREIFQREKHFKRQINHINYSSLTQYNLLNNESLKPDYYSNELARKHSMNQYSTNLNNESLK